MNLNDSRGPDDTPSDLSPGLRRALGATAFLGAALLFWIQPLAGKQILPWFGGSAAVWTTALLFFQTTLVLGYGAAYALRRWCSPGTRSYLFITASIGGLAVAAATLDVPRPPAAGADPTWSVLRLLAMTVGASLVVAGMTGPLTQEWFARAGRGRSPYRLYALSNLGSLVGLAAFPLVLEPYLPLATQKQLWTGGLALYTACGAACAWRVRRSADVEATASVGSERARTLRTEAAVWLAAALGGAVLLAAITNHLSQDASPGPLLWIAPLAVYLLSFMAAFDRPAWCPAVPSAIAFLGLALAGRATSDDSYAWIATCDLGLLAAGCWLLHGELARRKPPVAELTKYYLCIAAGGAAGGGLVALVAPLVFEDYYEYNLAIAATAAAAAWRLAMVIAGARATGAQAKGMPERGERKSKKRSKEDERPAAHGAPLAGRRRGRAIVCGAAALGVAVLTAYARRGPDTRKYEIAAERNFYGVVSVQGLRDDTGNLRALVMRNGSTLHGSQTFIPGAAPFPQTYYGPKSGAGLALETATASRGRRIGVVGLGVGTLAAYGRRGDVYRFYEINPAVVRFANDPFTYLRESRARTETILGDARLSLEAEPPQVYDVLVIDAFTSDSIPIHLLTLEAMEVYLRHLRDDGLLAVHVTNRHFDLTPVLAGAAERLGLRGALFVSEGDAKEGMQRAEWVLLARKGEDRRLTMLESYVTKPLTPTGRPWTDDHSSLWRLRK